MMDTRVGSHNSGAGAFAGPDGWPGAHQGDCIGMLLDLDSSTPRLEVFLNGEWEGAVAGESNISAFGAVSWAVDMLNGTSIAIQAAMHPLQPETKRKQPKPKQKSLLKKKWWV